MASKQSVIFLLLALASTQGRIIKRDISERIGYFYDKPSKPFPLPAINDVPAAPTEEAVPPSVPEIIAPPETPSPPEEVAPVIAEEGEQPIVAEEITQQPEVVTEVAVTPEVVPEEPSSPEEATPVEPTSQPEEEAIQDDLPEPEPKEILDFVPEEPAQPQEPSGSSETEIVHKEEEYLPPDSTNEPAVEITPPEQPKLEVDSSIVEQEDYLPPDNSANELNPRPVYGPPCNVKSRRTDCVEVAQKSGEEEAEYLPPLAA